MSCGTPLPRIQPQPVNVRKTCKKCGANLAPGARFCTNCGTPYVEETSGSPSGNSTGSAMGSAMGNSFGSSKPVEQPNYEPQQREESDSYQEPIQKEEQLQKQWENPAKKYARHVERNLVKIPDFVLCVGHQLDKHQITQNNHKI